MKDGRNLYSQDRCTYDTGKNKWEPGCKQLREKVNKKKRGKKLGIKKRREVSQYI